MVLSAPVYGHVEWNGGSPPNTAWKSMLLCVAREQTEQNEEKFLSEALNKIPACPIRFSNRVESRSGAVTVIPFRFQIPLIKPDVQISRIQLWDQGPFMLSPTGSCALSFPIVPTRVSRTDTRRDRLGCQLPGVGVWRTTTVAADIGYGHPPRGRLW